MKFKLVYFNCSQILLLLLAILLIAGLPLLLVLTDSTKLSAADYITKFEHLSIEDGLSQSVVFSILQDRNGYIWFGTQDGLNRYDGIDFTVFNRILDDDTSISDNTISTIFEDSTGTLWVGTLNGGLNRFNEIDNTFTSFQFNSEDNTSISHNHISAICEDNNGFLWIATHNGLNRFDPKGAEFTRYLHDPDNPQSISSNTMWSIYADVDGIIWLGMNNGLSIFDPISGRFTHYSHETDNPQSISGNLVRTIYQAQDGAIWLGTYSGLNKFDRTTQTFTRYMNNPNDSESISNDRIRSICEDDSGYLWLATTKGLNKMNLENGTFTNYVHDTGNLQSISSNVIWSLLYDNSGILWIGTLNGGINKLIMNQQMVANYQHNPSNPQSITNSTIKAIHEASDGSIWVGTLGGLNKLDPVNEVFTYYGHEPENPNSLSHNSILAITETIDGILWIGTTSGLERFDPLTENFTHYVYEDDNPYSLSSNIIWSLLAGSDGILWIGTHNGFSKLDLTTNTIERHYFDNTYLTNTIVYDIYEQDEMMWFATSNGLSRLDKTTNLFSNFTYSPENTSSISDNSINCIFEDSFDRLWFGTNGGLNKMDPLTGMFTRFTIDDGLPNNTIHGILEDDNGYLWLSTNKGLSKLNPSQDIFINYTTSDGLQSNEFSPGAFFKTANGRLYFGGINGLNAFYPSEINRANISAPTIITDFHLIEGEIIFDKPLSQIKEITLSYEQNSFEIEFAYLNYTSPHSNIYSYKLIGFEEEWRHCTAENRIASYTNLDNGVYSFTVRSSDSYNSSNISWVTVEITILAPFWKEWWFIALLILTSIALIYSFIQLRTQAVIRQKESLETQVKKRTLQLRDEIVKHERTEHKLQKEMKKRIEFTRALVHELKTPLTTLTISSDLLAEEASSEPYQSLSKSINRGVSSLRKRIDEMLDTARGEIGLLKLKRKRMNLDAFISDIISDLTAVAHSKGIDLICNKQEYLPIAELDEDRISQVISNLADNAFKFTGEGGVVTTDIIVENDNFIFTITDNGKGIKPSRQKSIFSPHSDSNIDSIRYGGLGLGLSLSKMLIELHRGSIWMNSKINVGSTFAFSVPIKPR
jgi:ligand-binding sensor domain-containing protein/signal transduction histidine kinase